jgi:hypothetical protein
LPQNQLRLLPLQHQLQAHQPKQRSSLQKANPPRKSIKRRTQSQLHQPLSKTSIDDNDDIVVDDEVTFGRNRKAEQFGKVVHEDEEPLSDYVMARLAQARELAMAAYRKAQA